MIKVNVVAGPGAGRASDAVVVGCYEDGSRLAPAARIVSRRVKAAAAPALDTGDHHGKFGEVQVVYPGDDRPPRRVILVGLGSRDDLDALALRRVAGRVGRCARRLNAAHVDWLHVPLSGRSGGEAAAQAVTEGFCLGAYPVPRHGSQANSGSTLRSLTLRVSADRDRAAARAGIRQGLAVSHGIYRARDVINLPGNLLNPTGLARAARELARARGLTCRVMNRAALVRMKAGGLLAVGQGSVHPPCLIQLDHRPPGRGRPVVYVVGKGITFDSGGLSIKPALNMGKMKYDMGGAGAVLGILDAVAALKLPVRVVGLIAAAENMPDGRAYRPGDVITQLDGTTVEVTNTDAEGRIVLGDALAWAARRKPDAIVDLATLTGACTVALGSQAVALLSNDDTLARQMEAAGHESGERVWRLPLWKDYRPLMASDVADLKNSGGREAGTITAGIFLETFVSERPWVHLDIAGTAWSDSEQDHLARGATGVGVSLVTRFLARFAG